MKRSGDRKNEFTAETRSRGVAEKDRVIGKAADSDQDVLVEHIINCCLPERARVEPSETSESRRTPRMPWPEIAVSGSSHDSDAILFFRNAWSIILAALREIFDESSYERFLLRTNAARSIASYRAFTRERDAAMLKKPRCC